LLQLGELEFKAARYERAADYLKRARELRPEDATAAFYEGQALEKTGDLAGARDALEASVKLAPGRSVEVRVMLGGVYLGLKNPKAAEDQFEAVLLSEPGMAKAGIGLARAQIADGRFGQAVQQLLPLAQSQPRDAEIFDVLAQAYTGIGKKAEAERAQRRAEVLRGIATNKQDGRKAQ